MARSKEKSGLATIDVFNVNKPIIKEFFDKDAEIIKFLKMMLPSIGNNIVLIKKVYQSKNGKLSKYRINYIKEVFKEGEICPTRENFKNLYVQVNSSSEDGKFIYTDLTEKKN